MPPSDPIVEGGPVVKLKAHTPHNLTCRASGAKPAAEITWYRDGEIMLEAIYSKVRHIGRLMILKSQLQLKGDSSLVTC